MLVCVCVCMIYLHAHPCWIRSGGSGIGNKLRRVRGHYVVWLNTAHRSLFILCKVKSNTFQGRFSISSPLFLPPSFLPSFYPLFFLFLFSSSSFLASLITCLSACLLSLLLPPLSFLACFPSFQPACLHPLSLLHYFLCFSPFFSFLL